MKTALILQGRIGSSRLPGKAMMPIRGRPLLSFVMEALRKIPADWYILATDQESQKDFLPLAESQGFTLFVGLPLDVLGRFRDALRAFPAEQLIRATGDNPLVSWEMGIKILEEHRRLKADYSAYFGLPLGCGVEIIRAQALFQAAREAQDPYDREHVSSYVYRHPEIFDLHRPLAEMDHRSSFSFTIDTAEDFRRVSPAVEELWTQDGPPGLSQLIDWTRASSPRRGRDR